MSLVKEFMRAMGSKTPRNPALRPDTGVVRLQMRLINEEHEEVREALTNLIHARTPEDAQDAYAEVLKELADLRYVVDHCAGALGLPIKEAFLAVHASNMSKLDDQGRPIIDSGGKVLKGPNYRPPNMKSLLPTIIDDHGANQ